MGYLRKYYKYFDTFSAAFDDYCKQHNRDCDICFFGFVAAKEYSSDKRNQKFCKRYIEEKAENAKEIFRILDIESAMS